MSPEDVMKLIESRKTIRKYTSQSVEQEKIGMMIEAAMRAPSAGNLQNWNFTIVTSQDAKTKIARHSSEQYWIQDAPVVVIACTDEKEMKEYYGDRGVNNYSINNISAAIENFMLMGASLNIQCCWVGAFDENQIRSIISAPSSATPRAVITLGYPAEHPKKQPQKHIQNVLFKESYGRVRHNMDTVIGWHSPSTEKKIKTTHSKFQSIADKIKDKILKK